MGADPLPPLEVVFAVLIQIGFFFPLWVSAIFFDLSSKTHHRNINPARHHGHGEFVRHAEGGEWDISAARVVARMQHTEGSPPDCLFEIPGEKVNYLGHPMSCPDRMSFTLRTIHV